MKIEKLNENKIRIILSNQDLIEKNIDFNSFMSNSIETQDLFLDMLEQAEEKVGFITKDYKIKIEALAMDSGDFVVLVTRFDYKENTNAPSTIKNKKVTAKRKSVTLNSECLVYSFTSFDDFCTFSNYASNIKNYFNIAKSIVLYTYNSNYFLVFTKLNKEHTYKKQFYTLITEFGTHVSNPDLFTRKLTERGKILIKHNAIKICSSHFSV